METRCGGRRRRKKSHTHNLGHLPPKKELLRIQRQNTPGKIKNPLFSLQLGSPPSSSRGAWVTPKRRGDQQPASCCCFLVERLWPPSRPHMVREKKKKGGAGHGPVGVGPGPAAPRMTALPKALRAPIAREVGGRASDRGPGRAKGPGVRLESGVRAPQPVPRRATSFLPPDRVPAAACRPRPASPLNSTSPTGRRGSGRRAPTSPAPAPPRSPRDRRAQVVPPSRGLCS